MEACNVHGELYGSQDSANWNQIGGEYLLGFSDGGHVALSQKDVDAINAIQGDGQKEADAGISAAHDAWERRRFLNETSRELFRDLYSRAVDFRMPDASRSQWAEDVAKIAAEAAGSLLIQVHNVAATIRASGLDVS